MQQEIADSLVLRREARFATGKQPPDAPARQALLARMRDRWPDPPSSRLQEAAVLHGIGLAAASLRSAMVDLEQWADDPSRSSRRRGLVLGTLICLEHVDYRLEDLPTGARYPLRDALESHEDRHAMTVTLQGLALATLRARSPDRVLESWRRNVRACIDDPTAIDPTEFGNAVAIRSRLESFVGVLSWDARSRWETHIRPIDQLFLSCTVQRDGLRGAPQRLDVPKPWWAFRELASGGS